MPHKMQSTRYTALAVLTLATRIRR